MEGELKVQVEEELMVQVEEDAHQTSDSGVRSRSPVLLLLVTLCLAAAATAALLLDRRHTQGSGADEEEFDLRHTLRHISHVRAAIHLHGVHNSSVKNSAQWVNQVDQAHSQGGLHLENNEIVIPRNGLYFVYSQASFRVSCSSADPEDRSMVHLSHTVSRWSDNWGSERTEKTYRPILHSIRTACQKMAGDPQGDGRWFSTVYMGAVFNLNRGDHLRTRMKEEMLEKLEDDPDNTYFGVFAL